ncbi:MAG: 4-deoxy-4-formamido-L-arabinose-phosphoundecaprenol deformylase [Betaproteobacteria bacterium]|nr:4-deoxy-4-formamido-L-arabinose-phosphoundecaprenol deformylase [Betaproteobacteria bacterium]MBI2961154.1 4-deoxy-4-formamido-L-arabinose-phosphoundecaprenol deformylase [Betaproteobacteria bacterium]
MKLALKIDVDTYRGTREGVPRLIDLLKKHKAGATFLFSLGPDHTGRAIKRLFRRGFAKKVTRTSVLEHYGLKTLLRGTLLPGSDIGHNCADVLRHAREAGFEVGIHCWDHVRWQDGVAGAGAEWTAREMRLACERFAGIFGESARVHGAAGWQMNIHAFRLTQRLGFRFASDTRGTCPFVPVIRAEPIACPQLPTTLPTLDEMIGLDGIGRDNIAAAILKLSENPRPTGHVYTLHAEFEGGKLASVFERMLEGWRAMGFDLVSLGEIAGELDFAALPRHEVIEGTVSGRSGTVALQDKEFLA